MQFTKRNMIRYGLLILSAIVLLCTLLSFGKPATSRARHATFMQTNASADTKVEALRSFTATLQNVQQHYQQLTKKISTLQQRQHQVEYQQQSLKKSRKANAIILHTASLQAEKPVSKKSTPAVVNPDIQQKKQQARHQVHFIWLTNKTDNAFNNADKQHAQPSSAKHNPTFSSVAPFSLLPTKNKLLLSKYISSQHKATQKPLYTIPVNATLTDAWLMTPLIGRIPVNGNLPEPYHFKLVLSRHNLTANGVPLPGIKGAVMSGIASGDLLGHCVRGRIKSITFIFNDGRISTTQASGNKGLGYLSNQAGDPCIKGTLHTDAALFIGAQVGLAASQGYIDTLASTLDSATSSTNLISLLTASQRHGIGTGASAATQALQTWWDQRVHDSFDYVYVPNINPNTGKPRRVVVNITQQIAINANPNARRVSYAKTDRNIDNELS